MPLQHEQVECKLITAMDYEDIVVLVEGGDRRGIAGLFVFTRMLRY
jgi:hypothetical protein